MIDYDGPVIADICVDEKENVFPMIPSGAAHNEMKLKIVIILLHLQRRKDVSINFKRNNLTKPVIIMEI